MRFSCWRSLSNGPKSFIHDLLVRHCASGGSWSDGVVLFQCLPVAQHACCCSLERQMCIGCAFTVYKLDALL